MRSVHMFATVCVLILSMNVACALYEDGAATIKGELMSKGLAAQVVYLENSTYGIPTYVVVVNVTDGDYLTATRRAMVAAASVVSKLNKYPTGIIIGLIGPSEEEAYQFKINNIDIFDITYETFDNNLDASKDRAEKYFDSATVLPPEELKAYFETR